MTPIDEFNSFIGDHIVFVTSTWLPIFVYSEADEYIFFIHLSVVENRANCMNGNDHVHTSSN